MSRVAFLQNFIMWKGLSKKKWKLKFIRFYMYLVLLYRVRKYFAILTQSSVLKNKIEITEQNNRFLLGTPGCSLHVGHHMEPSFDSADKCKMSMLYFCCRCGVREDDSRPPSCRKPEAQPAFRQTEPHKAEESGKHQRCKFHSGILKSIIIHFLMFPT